MTLSRNLKRLFRLGAALPPVAKAEPEAQGSGSRPTRRLAAGTGHKAPETHPAPPNAAALGGIRAAIVPRILSLKPDWLSGNARQHGTPASFPFPRGKIFSPIRGPMSAELDVKYTAQLARLNLSEAEALKFQSQLSQVLSYVEKLKTVDVTGVEPTAHTSPVFNVFRADEPRPWFNSETALANAPRQANHLFVVPKVIE